MPTDVNRLLTSMQTGEYIPSDDEKQILEQVVQSPQRRLGQDAIDQLSYNHFDSRRQDALGLDAAIAGYGKSRYDRGEFVPDADLENKRAIEQPGVWKIANGAIKGGIYAATTAVEGVAGIIDGLLEGGYQAVKNAVTGEPIIGGGIVGKAVNNFTARTMQDIQRLSDEWFPNYRTTEEQTPEYQQNWQRHIFSANFIGDSFLKNFGFTVGAIGGGLAWSKILSSVLRAKTSGDLMKGVTSAASGNKDAAAALKATSELVRNGAAQTLDETAIKKAIVNSSKTLNSMSEKQKWFGSVISAMGEGTMEGVMARDEFMDNYLEQLNNDYISPDGAERKKLIEELKGTDAVRAELRLDENGEIVPEYVLTESGEDILSKRYNDKKAFAEDQADKVAATTFLLNLPILTMSNTIQFGKLYSGGWKTARNTVSKVAGGIANNAGKLTASYSGIGSKAARIVGNAAKLGGAEASEEMLQGFASSGAKKVADDRITAFNDDGYDHDTMRSFGSWLNSMLEGGGEYLSDWQNWQEGFMGLITGLVGMPGKGYFSGKRGGLAQAIADANSDVNASEAAALALNSRINSDKFADAWKGYVRHMKYDAQMGDAINLDDQYSWKTANDKQLINDIIMFADAGRLQDLYDIVDTYSNITPEQAEALGIKDAITNSENENEVNNGPERLVNKVRKQADAIKDNIAMYNDMYDAMSERAPIGTTPDQLKELIATSMGIRSFEKRYLEMFDDVIRSLDKIVKPLSLVDANGNELNEQQSLARAKEIYSALAEIYTGTGLPVDTDVVDNSDVIRTLNSIEKMINNSKDDGLKKKYGDMKKVASDRKAFLKKLLTLQNMSPAAFTEQAMNPAKAAANLRQEKANEETAGLDTVGKMKAEYLSKPAKDREAFVSNLLETKRPAAGEFAKLHDTFSEFKSKLAQKNPDLVNRRLGDFGTVPGIILNRLFEDSENAEDFVKKLDSPLMDIGSVNDILSQMVQAGAITEDEALPIMVNQMYAKTVSAIKDMAEEFKKSWNNSAGKNSIKQEPEKKAATVDDNANPTPAAKPSATKQDVKPEKKEEQVAEPAQQQEEKQESSDPITTEEASSDTNSTYTDNTIPEEDAYRRDDKGSVKLGYYQQSVPEIPTGDAKLVRELLLARKTASKEEMEVIDKQLNAIKIEDFVQFDDNGNPVGGEIGYADTVKWLRDNGAFKYISTELKPDQEVVFAIMDGAPKYEGKPQIVVGTVAERNSNGEITRVQPLTILHSIDKAGDYMGLNELYDAIYADYDSTSPEGSLYVFGGKVNPKTSKVFGIRPGLMRYNRESTGVNIETIPDYNPDAPIIILDDSNRPVLLRGNVDVSKLFIPNIYPWSSPHNGRLYYMVKNGSNTYTPVIIEKPTVTSNDVENAADGTYMAKIRDIASKIDEITSSLTSGNIQDSNNKLHKQLSELSKYYNIDGVAFSYDEKSGPGLNVNWITRHYVQGQEIATEHNRDFQPGESITPLFDELDRKVRISYRPDNIEQSKKNLSSLISEGLITSNVSEFRQVGTNMLYDPWNKDTGRFERILPSATPEQKSIPKSDKQTVAGDAEFGDTTVRDAEAQAPTVTVQEQPSQPAVENKTLDDVFGEAGVIQEDVDYSLDYDEQSGSAKAKIDEKMSRDVWDRWKGNDKMRKKLMGC